jgi:hypothetical protein
VRHLSWPKNKRRPVAWPFQSNPETFTVVEHDAWADAAELNWIGYDEDGEWSFYSTNDGAGEFVTVCLADAIAKWPQAAALHILKKGQGAVWHANERRWQIIAPEQH